MLSSLDKRCWKFVYRAYRRAGLPDAGECRPVQTTGNPGVLVAACYHGNKNTLHYAGNVQKG